MELTNVEIVRVEMSLREESALWRQRFFEAQAGMERYLTESYGNDEIARWLPVKAEILKDLDGGGPDADDVQSWKERFFKTQARLEKYVVDHHGLVDLEQWAIAISQIFKFTEPNRGGGATDFAMRFARQAHCYRSEYEITHASRTFAQVILTHCAIWDYREQARSRGVKLTLESPCTYCTKATIANASAKGFSASFTLQQGETGHGCTWDINRSGIKSA